MNNESLEKMSRMRLCMECRQAFKACIELEVLTVVNSFTNDELVQSLSTEEMNGMTASNTEAYKEGLRTPTSVIVQYRAIWIIPSNGLR